MQNQPNICPQCHSPIPADAPGGLCPACVLLGVAGRTNPSQAAAAAAPTMEEVAVAFPELEVLDILGQGGMGIVFKARQPRLDRFVALKVLPPALAAQPGFAERFTREARVLARLAHQNIVSIYDFGESAGFFYLIMEFVNGVNLRAAMRAGVTPEQALLLVPRICEALQFAHDHGVLHRDIKPENILLDTAGVPKLADFGIAKLSGEESGKTGLTATGHALGTAAYMAPEQVEKPATVDHRADIYSLGVVLYEMLTGELPLGRFAAPSEKSTVDQGVDAVVMRALEKERERRQQSASDFKTQVEGASHPGVPFAPRASGTGGAAVKEEPLVKRVLLALCAVCAVGIPLTGMMGWDSPNPRQMVMMTILFGTLAGLSKMFTAEIGRLMASRAAAAPAAPDPMGKGRTWAIRGLRLIIGSAVAFVLTLPLIWNSRHGRISEGPHIILIAIAGALIVASGWGFIATLLALIKYRFRARWFFWWVNAVALALLLTFGRDLVFTGIICLGTIGYSVFFHREFFSASTASTASPAATSMPADPAPNPWPHRLWWLVISLFVLPVAGLFSALLLPLVMRHDHFSFLYLPFALIPAILPFIAAGALYFGYRRTQPGADRATPRATWNPWPKRVFLLVVLLIVVPMTLIGIGIAVPMIAYRGAEAPHRPAKLKALQSRPPAASVVTAGRAPFIGELPQGSLELVSVSPHPANNQRGWRMDGSPASEGPFVNRGSKSTAQPGQRAYEFVFRTRNLPADASSPTWQLPGAVGWAGGGTPSLGSPQSQQEIDHERQKVSSQIEEASRKYLPGHKVMKELQSRLDALDARLEAEHQPGALVPDCQVISASFPKDLHKTNIRMGVAAGSWTTLWENRPGNSISGSFSREGEIWIVTQLSTIEAKDGQTVVTYACSPHEGWETRVVALAADGMEIPASRSSILEEHSEWRFAHLPLETVRQFRFQARRYQWIEFQNVALAPSGTNGTTQRSTARTASVLPSGTATLNVRYNKVESNAPGIYELILNSRTPTGWVTDFSCRVRDEQGEREIPEASFIVVRNQSSKAGDVFPAQVSWEFTTRNIENGNFQLNSKALPGNAGIASSSTSLATPYRWEPHPGRDESNQTLIAEAPSQIFFLRGVPSDPSRPEAEMYILVKTRPMRPGEKTAGHEALFGEDRLEKIASASVRKGDSAGDRTQKLDLLREPVGKARQNAGLEPEPRRDPSPEVVRLQDEGIRVAREQLETAKKRVEAGVAPILEQSAAERDLAVAEARGNELLTASALVMYADKRFNTVRDSAGNGTATSADALAAEQELNTARLRLEEARAEKESKRDPSLPAPLADPNDTREAIVRLRNEGVRLAREQLELARQLVEAGTAPTSEVTLAERNLAVAEARGDELKTAVALVAYAGTRSDLLKERVKAGTITPSEAAAAEQELNHARIRLEEARAKAGLEKDATEVEKPVRP